MSGANEGDFELLFSHDLIALGSAGGLIARGWFAGDSIRKIQAAVKDRFGDSLSKAQLEAFVEQLAPFSEGEAARAEREEHFRRAVSDHTLDLRDSTAIEPRLKWIEQRLSQEQPNRLPRSRLLGVLSPHGALRRTDPCAFRSYSRLDRDDWPDVFIVIGTSHYDRQPSVLMHDVVTRHGVIRCAHALAVNLVQRMQPRPTIDSPAFLVEHSWQIDLPILQALGRKFDRPVNLIAILGGRMTQAEGSVLGRSIADLLFETSTRAILIASGDLSHFGAGYPWAPTWVRDQRSVANVVDALQAFEQPALEAIARRDENAFERVARASSFCARGQVTALMNFVSPGTTGEVLDHASLVNWTRQFKRQRTWSNANDKVFDVSSIAFHLASATAERAAVRGGICRRVLLKFGTRVIHLFHPCDNETYELPLDALQPLYGLLDGITDVGALATRVSERIGQPTSANVIAGFIDQMASLSLLHEAEAPSILPSKFSLARAEATIAFARENVDGYASLLSNDLNDAPFLSSATLGKNERSFFNRKIASLSEKSLARDFQVRISSGSSGRRKIFSVVEKSVGQARAEAEFLLGVVPPAKAARVNRPNNLFNRALRPKTSDDGIQFREQDGLLLLSPGGNPVTTPKVRWQAIADRLVAFAPNVLEGDPLFLGALARHCISTRTRLPSLLRVELGHSFAWQRHLDLIRRAFGVPIRRRYHASELGTIAGDCPEGNLHLLECYATYEIIVHGRPAKKGEIGALVATTVDSQAKPLIRYVLGDAVRITNAKCRCGKPFRTIAFEGRLRFLFRDAEKRMVTQQMLDAAVGSPEGVTFFQFHIPDRGAIRLTIVPDPKARPDVCVLAKRVSKALHVPVEVIVARDLPVAEKVVTMDRSAEPSSRFVDADRYFFGRNR